MTHQMTWLNEPSRWFEDADTIEVEVEPKTDFWRVTHYGFTRDTGHLYGAVVGGDVDLQVTVQGDYTALYDQAGVMLRCDDSTWIKAGLELVDGVQTIGCVVTRDFSDWSMVTLSEPARAVQLRAERRGDAVHLRYGVDEQPWRLLRMAYLPPDRPAQVGVMCAAPEGTGFTARFTGLTIGPPVAPAAPHPTV
jgi:regulation of enolase protein 1 (concanavalin A-like superfamily)